MMLRLLTILLILWCGSASAIRFEGARFFKTAELGELAARAQSLEELVQAITQGYVEAGYLEASVGLKIAADTIVVISEGWRYRVGETELAGLDSAVVSGIDLSASEPLTAAAIEKIGMAAARVYANQGYPFASVQLCEVRVVSGRARLEFEVLAGPQTSLGEVVFTGLSATRPRTLLRRVDLHTDSLYREDEIGRAQEALDKVDYVATQAPARVRHDVARNQADVEFVVKEKRVIEVEGIATLDPDNSVAGRLGLGVVNALGYGERVSWDWERRNESSRVLALSAFVPYLGGSAFDVGVTARQSDRDSSYISARLGTAVAYHVNLDWQVGSEFSWQKITPEEGRISPSARILEAALSTTFDSRRSTNPGVPGVRLTSEFATSYRKSFASGQPVETGYTKRFSFDGTGWLKLGRSWMVSQRILAFEMRSDFDPLPDEQLTEIGGAGSLRGYRERSFLVREGVVGNSELQYLVSSEVILRIFSDNGILETQTDELRLNGFGAGASLKTSLGWFRLDLTLGESKQLDKLLVHFGFDSLL